MWGKERFSAVWDTAPIISVNKNRVAASVLRMCGPGRNTEVVTNNCIVAFLLAQASDGSSAQCAF